ncbi:nickel-responsive transcriptional regulator NikR [Aestuariirhabdus sp. Z084]|uniref:nickel-responsive transcriptional regulator NikR n=1 Tax=Aestuariirhabdus haliotis TaxID=2918751 RepID=UPI00201B3BEF|nr:nickel-responsive transcriptional regulator NikR [Aestuariirhabdus haliotis]MCL6416631.1 nickel-responsive transcriptional regulator NikR [Aestuariirhabdus haliotis]MCL6420666.1 nickel-responsive transcriptional regulator NikR [Aestuariirhabdus haliotis]
MERISISLEEGLVEQFEQYLTQRGYRNRSEAIRDLIRDRLESERVEQQRSSHCVGTLTYVYNHEERELSRRLTHAQHHHHNVAVSTLHVHLDHDNCLETVVVSGPTEQVTAFANTIIAEPGVRHGKLNVIPVDAQTLSHQHGGTEQQHSHSRPQT